MLNKSLLLVALSVLGTLHSFAQRSPLKKPLKPAAWGHAVRFALSPRLDEIREELPPPPVSDDDIRAIGNDTLVGPPNPRSGPPDPVIQRSSPRSRMPDPIVTFQGLRSADNFAHFGFRAIPPDPNGAVGPSHYVQMVNLLLRVYNKSGTPLINPIKLSSLFAPMGGQCADPHDKGDPIVLYDHLADRWLLSQFAFVTSETPPFHQCIAISRSPDPAGSYYLYDFLTPNSRFNDYPKFGVWPDAYYMTSRSGLTGAYAFERAEMLMGDPLARLIFFFTPPQGFLPASLDGPPPEHGTPNYLVALAPNQLRIFEFHADFGNPDNSSIVERPESPVSTAPFASLSERVPQPPPGVSLDTLTNILMHRLQYRNFGDHESLVVNHTVDVGPPQRAGVRYYELRRSLPGGSFSIAEQASFGPDDGDHRWMGSAGMDHEGNLAVGYSVSSASTYPSIRYAGRLSTDPPNGLFQGEATLVAGSGVQTLSTPFTGNRWGDYTSLSVDPVDGCTFWYTNEYYTLASQMSSPAGWLTRIGSFKFPSCEPPAQGTLRGTVRDAVSGLPIAEALLLTAGGHARVSDASGSYSMDVPPGTYTLTASKSGYQAETVSGIVVTNGGATTEDIVLSPINPAGSSLTAESCTPENGVIDPGETVTVSFSLRNDGTGSTRALTATLQATGGVLNPSGPQDYGVLTGGGSPVARDFSFTSDPKLGCGEVLTAIFQLQDGATDLGVARFTFVLGAQLAPLLEDFDGVTAPALPTGWTSTGTGTPPWVTSRAYADTPPNAAHHIGWPSPSESRLDSPIFSVATPSARLAFRHYLAFDVPTPTSTDRAGVLEISIGGGAFVDILAAGGSFATGGYTTTVTAVTNPLFGREAWSGFSNSFITTIVNLPAAAVGQNVQLRWRLGTGFADFFSEGWRVDTVSVTEYICCSSNKPGSLAVAARPSRRTRAQREQRSPNQPSSAIPRGRLASSRSPLGN